MEDPTTQSWISVKHSSFKDNLYIIVLVAVVLYFGKMLFIPISFALLISFLLYPICHWMENKGLSRSFSIAITMTIAMLLIISFMIILAIQLNRFIAEWADLKLKLYASFNQLSEYLNNQFNISLPQQKIWLENIASNSGSSIVSIIGSTAYSVSMYLVLAILIPILSILLLYYRTIFIKTLYMLFPSSETEVIRKILHETILTYYNFIKGMITVYLIVGILNSIGLWAIGIPYPILFGFLASILTFIPYVGIMIASLLPITISWIMFNSIWYPVGVISIFAIVQYLEANIIFPIVVSSKLNINTFATVIAILVGGILWGGAGMILFVPFVAIIKLIADKTESLKIVSMLLGTEQKTPPTIIKRNDKNQNF